MPTRPTASPVARPVVRRIAAQRTTVSAPPPNGSITVPAQQSAYFDGETGRYTFTKTADWDLPNSDWAMVVLVKNDYQQSGPRYIFDNAASGGGMFRLYIETGRPWANFQIGAANRLLNSSSNVNNGQFTLLVLQRNGSNYQIRSCTQGGNTVTSHFSLAHTDNAAQALAGTTIHLGSRFDQNAAGFLNQYISWFAKINGSSLTDAQIISLAGGTDIASLGLDLRMHVKVTGEATLTDLTGRGNTGTRVGGVYPRGHLAIAGQPFAITGNDNSTRGFVFQRPAGATSRNLSFAGTYNGAPAGIEARICSGQGTQVMPWTACTTPSAGNWAITFANVPQGGGYYLEVRDTGTPTNLARSIWHFGVGAVLVWTGQSNAAGMFASSGGSAYTVNTDLFLRGSVRRFDGTYPDIRSTSAALSGVMPVIDVLSAQLGVPVMAVDASTGGSGLVGGWDNRANTFYQNFLARLGVVGDTEGIVWVQGEADGASSSTVANNYLTSFGTLINNFRADVGRVAANLPVYLAVLGRKGSAASPDSWAVVRTAQMNAETNYANVRLVGGYYDLPYTDDLHLNAASYAKLGRRITQAVLNHALPGSYPTGMKGPEPTSASSSGNTIIVTFTMHTGANLRGLLGSTGITGFEVRNGGNTVEAITSATITGANQVTLTMANTPAAGWTVRYIHAATFDNSTLLYSDAPVVGITSNDTVPALPTRAPLTI